MRSKLFVLLFPLTAIFAACQTTPVSPLVAEQGVEFALAPRATATIKDAGYFFGDQELRVEGSPKNDISAGFLNVVISII